MNAHGPGWSERSPEEGCGNSEVYLSVKPQAAVKHLALKLSARSEKDE